MLKNILIYFIVFFLLIIILFDFDNKTTNSVNETTNSVNETTNSVNEKEKSIIKPVLNERNFEMDKNSIVMSSNKILTKEECLNKVNNRDINGASYDINKNLCTLYFFAKKGKPTINIESKI